MNISQAAANARESARRSDGKFGSYSLDEATGVEIDPGLPSLIDATADVDPTAEVSPTARIDADAKIGPFAQIKDGAHIEAAAEIGEGARIGESCTVGPGALVAKNVTVDDRCLIGGGSVVGAGSFIENSVLGSGVRVEPMAYIEASMIADRARIGAYEEAASYNLVGCNIAMEASVKALNFRSVHTDPRADIEAPYMENSWVGEDASFKVQQGLVNHVYIGMHSRVNVRQCPVPLTVGERSVVEGMTLDASRRTRGEIMVRDGVTLNGPGLLQPETIYSSAKD